MSDGLADRPNRVPWPPLILFSAAALAVLLRELVPLELPLHAPAAWIVGILAVLAGGALDGWAIFEMRRRRANILPHRAATALVTTGPFALSRNPIYLGNTLLLIGVGVGLRDGWFVAVAIAAAWGVSVLAIRREEAHLAARFGDAWTGYARHVRRWIGRRR